MHFKRALPRLVMVVLATTICTRLGLGGTAHAATGQRWTLATDDTVMTIGRDGRGGVAIVELKNSAQQFNWVQKPCPVPLMNRVECDGKSITPDWMFQNVIVDKSDGTKLTLRFTSTRPKLEMKSQWWARRVPGRSATPRSSRTRALARSR